MQTFLPYANFTESVRCLDRQRLNKQRSECKTLLSAILRLKKGYSNHPVTKQWRPFPRLLWSYAMEVRAEWMRRGYQDNMGPWYFEILPMTVRDNWERFPWWLGFEPYHESHQANLKAKLPEHYNALWKTDASPVKLYPLESEPYCFDVVREGSVVRISGIAWKPHAALRASVRVVYRQATCETVR